MKTVMKSKKFSAAKDLSAGTLAYSKSTNFTIHMGHPASAFTDTCPKTILANLNLIASNPATATMILESRV